jgi:hypothetical protein
MPKPEQKGNAGFYVVSMGILRRVAGLARPRLFFAQAEEIDVDAHEEQAERFALLNKPRSTKNAPFISTLAPPKG